MSGPDMPERPKAVAFDIIGTIFPLEPLRSSIETLGLPSTALEGWFAAGCRDAFALAAVGDFEPFTTMLEGALDQVLAEHGLDAPARERKALVKGLETLDAREGAREAFSLLAEAGIPVIALSNGAAGSTRALIERAQLGDLVQAIVSVEEIRLAKPRTEVYLHAADKAGIRPAELGLVAAHPWDIHGAAAAGLVTAYLSADRPYSPAMRKPDLEGRTLPDLARRLVALRIADA